MSREGPCPIWQMQAQLADPDGGDRTVVEDCPRAGGGYLITGTASRVVETRDDHAKARLTSWLIDQRRLGVEHPEITSDIIHDVEQRRPLSVQERSDSLLQILNRQQRHIGDTLAIEVSNQAERMYGPGYTELGGRLMAHSESVNPREVTYLLGQMEKRGFLETIARAGNSAEYLITVDGYAHLAELEHRAIASKQAFVAMWFDESLKAVYDEGIVPAIRDAGYEPLRIDQKEHINKIDDEIIAEIRRSRFLVADFTQGEMGARGGVYYEAGFAHGLNIPVIFTCRQDAIGKVHFDTQQYNHITWRDSEDLRLQLSRRIAATIGDGPLRNPK